MKKQDEKLGQRIGLAETAQAEVGDWGEYTMLLKVQKGQCRQNMGSPEESGKGSRAGLNRPRAQVYRNEHRFAEKDTMGQSRMRKWHNSTSVFIKIPGSLRRNNYAQLRMGAQRLSGRSTG